ncbi:MAG: DUF2924 domain-containing protein [Rhodospirillaceae bacterium]
MTTPILRQIAELHSLDHGRLKGLWREYYGTEPPGYRRGFLIKALAFRIQELTYGGLPPEVREELDARIDGEAPKGKRRNGVSNDRPVAGTRLIREWQGIEHHVTVRTDGFEYAGRKYKSLSAIARAITGTRWNGPLFFGLRKHGSLR